MKNKKNSKAKKIIGQSEADNILISQFDLDKEILNHKRVYKHYSYGFLEATEPKIINFPILKDFFNLLKSVIYDVYPVKYDYEKAKTDGRLIGKIIEEGVIAFALDLRVISNNYAVLYSYTRWRYGYWTWERHAPSKLVRHLAMLKELGFPNKVFENNDYLIPMTTSTVISCYANKCPGLLFEQIFPDEVQHL
jgi:hypothetical protein